MSDKPVQVASPDFTALQKVCQDYINELANNGYADDDFQHYIYESAIEAFFGKDVWRFINDPNTYSASNKVLQRTPCTCGARDPMEIGSHHFFECSMWSR